MELRIKKLNYPKKSLEYKSVMNASPLFSFEGFCENYLRIGERKRQRSDYDKHDFWIKFDDYQIYEYNNVIIDGCSIVYDEHHQPIKEALNTYDDVDYFVNDKGCVDFSGIKPVETEKAPILFFDHYFYNFGHFTMEAFPRLFLIKELIKEGHKVLVPTRFNEFSYIQPCLDSIGITIDDIIEIPAEGAFFSQLIMPSHVKFRPDIVLPAIEYLKSYFFEAEFKWDYPNVYISRDDTKLRNITNKIPVEYMICKYFGFKKITMSDYSFKDKINIIMRTRIVVSVDSSSPINCIFMQKKGRILVFRPFDFGFFNIALASLFDHDLTLQVCPFGTTDTSHFAGHLFVNVVKLFDNLCKIAPDIKKSKTQLFFVRMILIAYHACTLPLNKIHTYISKLMDDHLVAPRYHRIKRNLNVNGIKKLIYLIVNGTFKK